MIGIASLDDYLALDINQFAEQLASRTLEEWARAGEEHALTLFRQANKRVPAYRGFLASHGVAAESVTTMDDFRRLPLMDKENYIDRYPLQQLVWDGDLSRTSLVNTTPDAKTVNENAKQ